MDAALHHEWYEHADEHADAMSSSQSRGFHIDLLRELARLYIEHGFITANEADTFMPEVPIITNSIDEPQAHVTDQLLGDPDSDMGDLLPNRPSFDLSISKHSPNPSTELSIGSALQLMRCKLYTYNILCCSCCWFNPC